MKSNASQHPAARRARQAGLTLIELLVVLVILTGIGGLLIPTITNALTRTHIATCSANFPEVHSMVQRALFDGNDIGNFFESGIDETGASVNGYATGTLSADEVAALNAIGITDVVDHDTTAADYNVTFNIGNDASGATTITDATPLFVIDNAGTGNTVADYGLYLQSGNSAKYVLLSIGRDWTKLGEFAPEPPVHFGDAPGDLPHEKHSRFGVILQVAEDDGAGNPVALEKAQFKTVGIALNGTDIETRDAHTEVYWTEVAN